MACTFIDHLVDEWCRKVIFRADSVKVAIICAYANGALSFVDGDGVGYPRRVCNGVDESSATEFIYFNFNSWVFGWL